LFFSLRIEIFFQCHNHLLWVKWNKYTFLWVNCNL
jgi:hypothetical protein